MDDNVVLMYHKVTKSGRPCGGALAFYGYSVENDKYRFFGICVACRETLWLDIFEFLMEQKEE